MTGKERQSQGLAGQLAVMKKLVEKGYSIFIPAGDHCPFDLISYKNDKLTRISVKSTSSNRGGKSWVVDLRQQSGGRPKKLFDKSTSDVVAVYITPEDRVKFFLTNEITNTTNISIQPI